MRLWQKIFLLTLCLTALSANSVSFLFLIRSHGVSLNLAKEKLETVCDGAVSELGHLIQEKKEEERCLMLTASQMEDMMDGIRLDAGGRLLWADSEQNSETGQEGSPNKIVIKPVDARSADDWAAKGTALVSAGQLPPEVGSVRSELAEKEGQIRIRRSTTIFLEGIFYRVEVSSDVSELFEGFRQDLAFSQWMSGAVSLMTAAVLLFSILYMTRPLKCLETATEQIAAGEYGYRVSLKGHDEIAELSDHMNEMAEEIQIRIRQVEELARSRETFIANMAHELKTPLTSILGFADIMTVKSHMGEEERREYAAIIAAEAKRLKLLSSRLMELISIQETDLALHPVNLTELIERALEVFEPVCREHSCTIRWEPQPLWVEADEALFTSLVLNLLDNALKASAPGQEIVVSLGERDGSAVLEVWDRGMGIPEEDLGRVTEAFYMVDKTRSRSNGGSGVGLALCKAIVEAHYGTLRIESKEGQGTTVTLVLPCVDGVMEKITKKG